MKIFLICLIAQSVLFIPFFIEYLKDVKDIGKDNLAAPLSERFISWCLFVPIWLMPIVIL